MIFFYVLLLYDITMPNLKLFFFIFCCVFKYLLKSIKWCNSKSDLLFKMLIYSIVIFAHSKKLNIQFLLNYLVYFFL